MNDKEEGVRNESRFERSYSKPSELVSCTGEVDNALNVNKHLSQRSYLTLIK